MTEQEAPAPQRSGDGKFKKLSIAERARRLRAKYPKWTNAQISKKLGVRPQVVYRALNRDKGRERVYITKEFRTSQLERLAAGETAECDEVCQSSVSKTCECNCGGLNHGIGHLSVPAEAEAEAPEDAEEEDEEEVPV